MFKSILLPRLTLVVQTLQRLSVILLLADGMSGCACMHVRLKHIFKKYTLN